MLTALVNKSNNLIRTKYPELEFEKRKARANVFETHTMFDSTKKIRFMSFALETPRKPIIIKKDEFTTTPKKSKNLQYQMDLLERYSQKDDNGNIAFAENFRTEE